MWSDEVIDMLAENKTYSRRQLYEILSSKKKDFNESTFRWSLYNLQKRNRLFKIGYDKYTTSKNGLKPIYRPFYTEECLKIQDFLVHKHPDLVFVIFESVLLNEFLNHQIAQNTIYIQVERDISSFIFNELQEELSGGVLYKPSKREFDRYWTKGCLVVLDLVSQAPLSMEKPHSITAEKLLVDIVSEKSISATFSPSELPDIFRSMINGYKLDLTRMNRYAGRRGRAEEIQNYIGGEN